MKLSLTQFKGMAPKIAPRLLPAQFGQRADEVKLWSGELRPFYEDQDVTDVPDDTVSLYKWRVDEDWGIGWLTFNRPVSVVKGPVFGDENNRILISGLDGGIRITDTTMVGWNTTPEGDYEPQTITPSNSYSLAIPVPSSVTMQVNGSSTQNRESRSYVVALVREWSDGKLDIGKTSDPAKDASGNLTVTVGTGDTVSLTITGIPEDAYSDAGVRKMYVYRSTVGSEGTATYGFVGEVSIAPGQTSATFTDSRASKDVEESAVSLQWDAPSSKLKGLISLNNGVLAAYDGSDVYFSYPYQVHAWPFEYRVSVDYDIVGLGAFGNTVVICTKGCPSLALVSDPATATLRGIHDPFPCLSADTIVSTASGVVYASDGGLLYINSTSPKYLTEQFISKDEWRDWNPSQLVSASFEGNYIGISKDPKRYHGIIFDMSDTSSGVTSLYRFIRGIYSDPESNNLYFIVDKPEGGRKIVLFDTPVDGQSQSYRTYRWRSKIFTSEQGIATMAAARVRNEYEGYAKKIKVTMYEYREHTLNSVPMNTYDINGPVDMEQVYEMIDMNVYMYFIYYVDGIPRYTRKLRNSQPFRLPSGFRGDEFEVEVEGEMPIHSIEIASSMGELL